MPKMKTKKAAAKRYKVSGSGKVIAAKAHRRHLLSTQGPQEVSATCAVLHANRRDQAEASEEASSV